MAASNANLWVLDFLLEADGLDDTLIKHFHDVNASQFEELPPNTQARLMLRVLRDAPSQPTGIAEAALGALNMLKGLADTLPPAFVPGANLEALKPSAALFVEVKTELVLKSLREGYQGEHPKVLLDTFFMLPEQGGQPLDPLELDRRNEILEGLKSAEDAQALLARYPVNVLNEQLLLFVATAREALGPNLLKLVERDIIEGRYNPYAPPGEQLGAQQAVEEPRGRGARGAAAKRKRASKAEQEGADGLASLSNADGMELQVADGTPGSGTGKPPGAPQRRRNGRWNEEETNFLIRMVREKGKGKWKRILEEGGPIFQNRSQVDLKDKWRNLERQGVVGPADLPPQQMAALGGQMGITHHVPAIGPDGQILAHTLVNADGQPLTAEQAQQYAQAMAHYALQQAASQQQLPPEMLQQQMHQMQHLGQLQPHMAPQQMQMHQQMAHGLPEQAGVGEPGHEQQQQLQAAQLGVDPTQQQQQALDAQQPKLEEGGGYEEQKPQ